MMITKVKVEDLTAQVVSSHGVVRLDVGRALSPEELVQVGARLGKPQAFGLQKYQPAGFPPEVTLIDTHGDGMTAAPRGFGEGWHQDSTYLSKPPEFTVLHALEVPRSGGDTLFADTRPALFALSGADLGQLSELTLEHALRATYRLTAADVGRTIQDLLSGLPKTRHPAVMLHPRGGMTLYISPLYTQENVCPETRPLFDRVLREVIKSQVVHRWKAGELVIWDNRVVLHAASGYLGSERRRMMRTVVHDVDVAP